MTCQDWRDASPSDVAPLYADERLRWQQQLDWDLAPALDIVEQGRAAGHVPGWIVRDERGGVLGWTYYVLHEGTLQIGGLSVSRAVAARRLLDTVLQSPEASLARRLSCFIFPQSRSVASAFERQRFALGQTRYLARPLEQIVIGGTVPGGVRGWQETDLAPAVRLLAASYEGVPGATCFAPDGAVEQWAQYAVQLTRVPSCGDFDPALSFVCPSDSGSRLQGAVMVTRISPTTAHVAQLAVSPVARRAGLGRTLLHAATAACIEAGLSSMTLMVDAANTGAGALYARLGFTERARFLYGGRAARSRIAA